MPTGSVLLRLFLIIALVFNGAMSAAASVNGMAQSMAGMGEHPIATASGVPCHEMMVSMPASGNESPPLPAAPSKGKFPAGADCCKSNACRCVCVQAAFAAMLLLPDAPVAIAHTPSIRSLVVGHPNPALPHLVRPPIG